MINESSYTVTFTNFECPLIFEHDWECISPGEYDFLYKCKKCKKTHLESIDNPVTKVPTYGCTVPRYGCTGE